MCPACPAVLVGAWPSPCWCRMPPQISQRRVPERRYRRRPPRLRPHPRMSLRVNGLWPAQNSSKWHQRERIIARRRRLREWIADSQFWSRWLASSVAFERTVTERELGGGGESRADPLQHPMATHRRSGCILLGTRKRERERVWWKRVCRNWEWKRVWWSMDIWRRKLQRSCPIPNSALHRGVCDNNVITAMRSLFVAASFHQASNSCTHLTSWRSLLHGHCSDQEPMQPPLATQPIPS